METTLNAETTALYTAKGWWGDHIITDADCFDAVAGLCEHLPIARLFEHVAQFFARQLFVVYDDGL